MRCFDPWLPIVLIGFVSSAVGRGITTLLETSPRAHTEFLLWQIENEFAADPGEQIPSERGELPHLLRDSNIDWNSCSLHSAGITDSWGNELEITYLQSLEAWLFRSAGQDGVFLTRDDISNVLRR